MASKRRKIEDDDDDDEPPSVGKGECMAHAHAPQSTQGSTAVDDETEAILGASDDDGEEGSVEAGPVVAGMA